MFAASAWEIFKHYNDIDSSNISLLIVGNIVAFIVALMAIRSFIRFLTNHGFKIFGYYRIIVGGIILVMLLAGVDLDLLD
jgi:undecaprenyl-diphosphatase